MNLMTLPSYQRVLFANSPLVQVIAQVRFPALPRFDEPGFVAEFVESLAEDYPIAERAHQQTIIFSAGEAPPAPTAEYIWRMTSKDKAWTVALAQGAVTLEASRYSYGEELIARFSNVLDSAASHLGVTMRSRLGLRYVNEIRYPGAKSLSDWAHLLRPELLGFALNDIVGGTCNYSRQEVRIERPDGTLAIKHGLFSEVETSEKAGSYYLLDLDYYDGGECDLDPKETMKQLREYNELMYRLFRWTLQDKLCAHLEPEDVS